VHHRWITRLIRRCSCSLLRLLPAGLRLSSPRWPSGPLPRSGGGGVRWPLPRSAATGAVRAGRRGRLRRPVPAQSHAPQWSAMLPSSPLLP